MDTTAVPHNARQFTATPAFEALARAGYVARGLIYAVIGVLAFRLAEGVSTQPASQQGALRELAHQTFGHALLVLMAIGLAGYAIWRAAQALVGSTPEAGRHSTMDRAGAVGSGIAYAILCWVAISILSGSSGGSSNGTARKATSGALGWPAGREIVGVVGLVLLGIAAYQAYMGISRSFLEDSKTGQMRLGVRKGFTLLGVVGLCARAVVFALTGMFVLKAAIDFSAKQAVGLDGALYRLTKHAYGTTLLIVVACGLIAFGVYSLADARYRKI